MPLKAVFRRNTLCIARKINAERHIKIRRLGVLSVFKQVLVSSRDGELKITQPKTATSLRLISLPQKTEALLKEEHAKHPLNIYIFPSPRTGVMYPPDSTAKLHGKILNLYAFGYKSRVTSQS